MSVIRSVHDRNNPYVQINKKVFDDPKISLKAKGFIGYCLSKPNHWEFYVEQLASVLKEGKRAIYAVIKECIEHGYAFRKQERKPNGDFDKWVTIISDSKEEIKIILAESGFADAQLAVPQKSTLVKNEAKVKNDLSNPPLSSPPKPKVSKPKEDISLRSEEEEIKSFGFLEGTVLSEKDKLRLTKKYPEEKVKRALKISERIEIKKTLMSLLLNILDNPDNYEETPTKPKGKPKKGEVEIFHGLSDRVLVCCEYNEKLRKVLPNVASKNELSIRQGRIEVFSGKKKETLSLDSDYFDVDMKAAMTKIDAYLETINT